MPKTYCIELTELEEDRCRRYGFARALLGLLEFGALLGVLAGFTLSGAAGRLLHMLDPWGLPLWATHLLFLLATGVVVRLFLFPLQFLDEFVLERWFGLSHEGLGIWLLEWLARSLIFGGAMLLTLFAVAETLHWWIWLAIPWCFGFLLARNLFYDWVYYPFMRWFYPVRFLRMETFLLPGLGQRTLPVYEVQVSHRTRRVNASIRVQGDRTAIYVTDTLIDAFTDGEERIVMAHEFGHLYDLLHRETRTRVGIAQAQSKLLWGSAQLLAGFGGLVLLHLLSPCLGLSGAHDLAGFPLLASLTLLLARLVDLRLCREARRDEQDADEYALAITGDVRNYVSVMRKLRQINLEERQAPPWRVFFDTHPSFEDRVNLARQYRRRYR